MTVTGAELAIAFNTNSDKKGWTARSSSRTNSGLDLVHFQGPSTIITLTYDVMERRFIVRFNKAHAAFGDYVKSIAKALYYVLTVLKSAGMPFDAPLSPAGVRVVCEATDDSTVYAEWPGMLVPQTASDYGAPYGAVQPFAEVETRGGW